MMAALTAFISCQKGAILAPCCEAIFIDNIYYVKWRIAVRFPLSLSTVSLIFACTAPGPIQAHDERKSTAKVQTSKSDSPVKNFTSAYTDLTIEPCTTIELEEDGTGYIREQCGAFRGVPLFHVEGDLRQHAYAGSAPSGQTTIAPFNYLGDKVEWRLLDGQPIALIYRLRADSPEIPGHGKTQLFVQKIGLQNEQSCIIGIVAGSYPKANEKARDIADTATNVACNEDFRPTTFGEIM